MISNQLEYGAASEMSQRHHWNDLDDQINKDEANAQRMEQGAAVARKFRDGNVLHFPGLAWGGHIMRNGKPEITYKVDSEPKPQHPDVLSYL